jgi:hypothetical protein
MEIPQDNISGIGFIAKARRQGRRRSSPRRQIGDGHANLPYSSAQVKRAGGDLPFDGPSRWQKRRCIAQLPADNLTRKDKAFLLTIDAH